jgi:hypothetical protein
MRSTTPISRQVNPSVLTIVKANLYLGRAIQEADAMEIKHNQFEKVRALLREARLVILLQPATHAECLTLLPEIGQFLVETELEMALAA